MEKNNLSKFKRFLVIDAEYRRVMAYDSGQFCYCTDERWEDEHHPARVYTYAEAKDLIRRTKRNRKRNGFTVGEYLLVPIITTPHD
jgi:hypothetical protein